jgi:hypothetical protein
MPAQWRGLLAAARGVLWRLPRRRARPELDGLQLVQLGV